MSGGSYDYFTFKLSEFADQVERRINRHQSDEVRAARLLFVEHLRRAANAARAIEWVDSGDWGAQGELKALEEYFNGFNDLPGRSATELAERLRDTAALLEQWAGETNPSVTSDGNEYE